jgi:hypothetical protein
MDSINKRGLILNLNKEVKKESKKTCPFCLKCLKDDEYDYHVVDCQHKSKVNLGLLKHELQHDIKTVQNKISLVDMAKGSQNISISLKQIKKEEIIDKQPGPNTDINSNNTNINNFGIVGKINTLSKESSTNKTEIINNSINLGENSFSVVGDKAKIITKESEIRVCPLCNRHFPNSRVYEIHAKHCDHNDNPYKREEELRRLKEQQNNYMVYEIEREELTTTTEPQNTGQIDFTNPNLGYEDLLRLDENISHPLGLKYLKLLKRENITEEDLKSLHEDLRYCMICFDEIAEGNIILRLPCNHLFHSDEIVHWFEKNKTCPTCRAEVEELLNNNK